MVHGTSDLTKALSKAEKEGRIRPVDLTNAMIKRGAEFNGRQADGRIIRYRFEADERKGILVRRTIYGRDDYYSKYLKHPAKDKAGQTLPVGDDGKIDRRALRAAVSAWVDTNWNRLHNRFAGAFVAYPNSDPFVVW